MNNMISNTGKYYNKKHKLELEKQRLIKCSRCPYHKKENEGKQQKSDKYKNIDKKTLRKMV